MSRQGISSPKNSAPRMPRVALLLAVPILLLSASALNTSPGQAKSEPNYTQLGASNDGYIGSQACSNCHSEIYQRFLHTSMGHSMSLVTPTFLQNTASSASYAVERLNRRFEVYSQDGNLFQSESGTGVDGKESFRTAHQIDWIIGAGVNGYGAILRKGNFLFQAPLSFYTRPMKWAPSPGYEFTDLGFNRPITPGCIFCHSGRPNPVPGVNGRFESHALLRDLHWLRKLPRPWRCSSAGRNCHVRAIGGKPQRISIPAIVNPARLTPYLADNICMACHQTGDARVLKPGKSYQDFRPGHPLDDTLSILDGSSYTGVSPRRTTWSTTIP